MDIVSRKAKLSCTKCGRYIGEFILSINPVPVEPIGEIRNIKCARCKHKNQSFKLEVKDEKKPAN